MKLKVETIIQALESRKIPFVHTNKFSNDSFVIKNPYAINIFNKLPIGSKIVRVTRERWGQHAIFQGMNNEYDEIRLRWIDPETNAIGGESGGWQCRYFIPLNWIEPKKSYLPSWL